jgi:replicative DNA helicase
MSALALETGLPCNLDAERFLLGSIVMDDSRFAEVAGALKAEDFSQEKHRRIFQRMIELSERGEHIDRVTVANELRDRGELESCDGVSYLVSLDDGLPRLFNLDSYVRIVQEKSTLRQAIFGAQRLMSRCLMQESSSSEILADAEAFLAKLGDNRQQHGQWVNPGEVIRDYPGGVNAFLNPTRGGSGIATPWPMVTTALCGLQKADLVLVAGRPSMGKSVVAMQMAHHAAKQGNGVAFISLEMTKDSLVRRLVAAVGRVDAQRLRSGLLNSDERLRAIRAASEIENLPLWIDDSRARTIPAITAALRKLIARHDLGLVLIDHLQLMRSTGRAESRHQELSEISHSLKHLAGELDLPVVLLSQLNRDCEREKRRPQLADLKETGSLEEDADVVLFIHRPEQYNRQDETLHGVAEFIIGKQRNGPTGKLNMVFLHGFQKFEQQYRDPGDEPEESSLLRGVREF